MVERLCSVGGMEGPEDRGPGAIQWVLASDYDALLAAARQMDCYWCRGTGKKLGTEKDCYYCADLRAIIGGSEP